MRNPACDPQQRVLGWQTKLHPWALEDPQRCFDDLFNLLCDPATLLVAWELVKQNRGSRTAGVDGQTRARIEEAGVQRMLLQSLRDRSYAPLPVRERAIPKRGSGKVRRLGIPALRDRVVQMAAKLVLEPILETDFCPISYGFRPGRRTQDAIEHVRRFINAPSYYEWVIEGDVENCFGSSGERIAPCGTPDGVAARDPCSRMIPAPRNCRTSRSTRVSVARPRSSAISSP